MPGTTPAPNLQPQSPPPDPALPNNPAAAANAQVYREIFGNHAALEQAGTQLLDLQVGIEQAIPVVYSLMSGRQAPTAGTAGASNAGNNVAVPILPQPTRAGQTYLAMVGTNGFAMDAETMRLLYSLHNQLQLALPALRAVNGIPMASSNSVASLPFTNRFTTLPTSAPVAPLAPTSR